MISGRRSRAGPGPGLQPGGGSFRPGGDTAGRRPCRGVLSTVLGTGLYCTADRTAERLAAVLAGDGRSVLARSAPSTVVWCCTVLGRLQPRPAPRSTPLISRRPAQGEADL